MDPKGVGAGLGYLLVYQYYRYHNNSIIILLLLYLLQLSRGPCIQVNTAPGTHSITAAKWREPSAQQQTNTTHIVKIEPGESISLTLSV